MASQEIHVDTVRLPLGKGASIDKAKDNGATPLRLPDIMITSQI
jgi:hypothetical protein